MEAARSYLEKGLNGDGPLPDFILLDLDLGRDSGYELLRVWHSTPALAAIPVMVWSILGDEQRSMCGLFGVKHYVAKWEGPAAVREVFARLVGAS